jgi:preprotein translocase subunit SecD
MNRDPMLHARARTVRWFKWSIALIMLASAVSALAEPLRLEVIEARPGVSREGKPSITVILSKDARSVFADFTRKHLGSVIEVRAGNRVLMKVRLTTTIEGGRIEIADSLNHEEVSGLASRLSSEIFKIEVEAVSE